MFRVERYLPEVLHCPFQHKSGSDVFTVGAQQTRTPLEPDAGERTAASARRRVRPDDHP